MSRLLGSPFMAWQRYVADVVGEIDPATGRLAYSEFGVIVPRQSGKSKWILAKAVHRTSATSFFGRHQQVVYTAQTRKDARRKWEEDYAEALAASSVFGPKIAVHLGNGNEHIRFPNRSRFGIESTTEKSGHGPTIDEAYVDEAWAQPDGRTEQAFRPAMITRANKQLGWVSTVGWDDYGSDWLKAKMQAGRTAVAAGERHGLAYFEWSAPDGTDPADRDAWWASMPALGQTITEDAIAGELDAMGAADFSRAYLNMWVPRSAGAARVIDLATWDGLADRADTPLPIVDDQPIAVAFHVSPDRSRATVTASGFRSDGHDQVEVLADEPGTGWVVPMVAALVARRDPCAVVLDGRGPAASLLPDLEAAGIDAVVTTAAQMAQACGGLYDAAVQGEVRHLNDPLLNAALAAATKRRLGDAWAWNPRDATTDISPLIAVTLARWGLMKFGRKVPAPAPQLIRSVSEDQVDEADVASMAF